MALSTLLAALVLIAVHLLAGRLRFLHVIPRSQWLSMAGGASVAYVFVHLLPELEEGHQVLQEQLALELFEHPTYLVALGGLAIFYGLERYASRKQPGETRMQDPVFWIHIASFSLYNALIGYLLHREAGDMGSLLLFTLAMALHFLVNDYGLNEHHEEAYARRGRWIIAGAVLLGWGVGLLVELPEVTVALLIALLAGGVILNVLKEELPDERQSRFWAFALGALVYTLVLLAA